ncbi:MAG: hypothetical protein VYB24_06220, partial [Pseudomonadota bacterium]|nr:hypothetical protein [Pseudomonadota bacterium]
FYQQPVQTTTDVLARLDDLQKELDRLMERWAELEEAGNAIKDAR